MSPPSKDPWLRDAEMFHEITQDLYKKDKEMQEDMREYYSQNPDGLRRRLEDIEANALGFYYNEMNVLEDESGKTASEKDIKKVEENIAEAMLVSNPLFIEQNLQYRDKLIYPKDWKQLKKEEREIGTRGS